MLQDTVKVVNILQSDSTAARSLRMLGLCLFYQYKDEFLKSSMAVGYTSCTMTIELHLTTCSAFDVLHSCIRASMHVSTSGVRNLHPDSYS